MANLKDLLVNGVTRFIGKVYAPTPEAGDNSTQVATTAFVMENAGLNSELFNNKLDLNANNLDTAGKSLISGLGMPSGKYINLTLGESGSAYTAPANGYFVCVLSVGSGAFNMYVKDNLVGTQFNSADEVVKAFVPVQKGQIMNLQYRTPKTQEYKTLRFIYAEGAKND